MENVKKASIEVGEKENEKMQRKNSGKQIQCYF